MEIFGFQIGDVGAVGLVTLIVLLVLTGKLVPGSERDYWRDAYFEAQAIITKLASASEVTKQVLQTVDRTVKGGERT